MWVSKDISLSSLRYTLYGSIASTLPVDSKIKMIDIWLLHGLLMPFFVFLVLIISKLSGDRQSNKSHPSNVGPSNEIELTIIRNRMEANGNTEENGRRWRGRSQKKTARADKENWTVLKIGRIVLPGSSILFIFIFFAVAISQHI